MAKLSTNKARYIFSSEASALSCEGNMATLSTNKARYEELMKNPLLFLHKKTDRYNYCIWEALDHDFNGKLDKNEFKGNVFDYELVITDKSKEPNSDNGIVYFNIYAVDASNIDDWFVVFQSYIFRSQIKDDKYPYIHLLWMLNYREWKSENIVNTLNRFDVKVQPFLIKALSKICKCLSVVKQQQIKEALSFFNFNYNVYYPEVIKKAVNILFPKPIWESKQNLFQLVDSILNERNSSNYAIIRNEQPNNKILQLFRWLHDDCETIIDYSSLNSIYSLSSHKIQMEIVKRYFHDIRQGKTSLDIQLLEQFRDSKFSEFIRYRYCLYSPEEPINISVPLLCDCILTVCQTGGQSFQSFDGVLDFVVAHCDVTKPSIKLGMDEFIPKCNGGAVINPSFRGFIDYSLVCELDESKFTPENLQATIRKMLDKSHHHTYYVCRNDNERHPLSEELIQRCKRISTHDTRQGVQCESLFFIPDKDKWVINDSDYTWANVFLKEPLPAVEKSAGSHNTIVIDIEHASTDVLEKHIRSLVDRCEKTEDGLFVIESSGVEELSLLQQFSKPIAMRIIPRSFPLLGINFDLFGIKKALCENITGALIFNSK